MNDENVQTKETQVSVDNEPDAERPMVALTFDDGPYGPVTKRILETLGDFNGKATFFVVGSRIQGREDTVKMIADSGCEIGNHTFNHTQLNKVTAQKAKQELQQTDETVYGLTGCEIKVIRPPAGCYNKALLATDNRPFVLWSVDTMDWSHKNAQITISRVLDNVKDGDIILMHDLYPTTADACDVIIPELINRGYQLVTVSQLIQYRQLSGSVVLNKG